MNRSGATALVVLASVLLVGASVAGYARLAFFNSGQFADRASAALAQPAVRTAIGERVTDEIVLRNDADLIAARPLIASTVSGVVGGGAFRSLFRGAVLDAHRAIFTGDRDTLTLTLADVGTVVAAALEKLNPQLAKDLDAGTRVVLLKRDIGSLTGDVVRTGERLQVLAWVLGALTLLAGAAALVVSRDRRRTCSQLGVGLASAGLFIVVAYTVARALLVDGAAAGVWDAYLGDLRAFGWLLAGTGAVVAAAAASLIAPVDIERPLRAAWRLATTEPHTTVLRLIRAATLVAAGLLLITKPLAALQVAVTLAGVYLLFQGLAIVLRIVHVPAEERTAPADARPRRARRIAVPLVAAVLVAGGVAAFAAGGGTEAPAQPRVTACNGHAALCARRLDQVVLPATHNSMSAPLPGWYSAEQERPIGGQLDDGIRGLLLDTHYGDRLASGRVRTYFGSEEERREVIGQDGVSPEAVASALRLRARIGFRGEGKRGMYLCHSFCELGATPLADGLDDIHQFLVTHPGEVVVVVNQDYVTPADFVKAIGAAGLTRYAATLGPGPLPTLRSMIDSGRRLVLLAENHAGAASWYQLAYESLLQETPFHFDSAPQLLGAGTVCPPNRGPASAPLFLLNHWVTTAPVQRPSDAAKVNAYAPLLARAQACERIRKRLPNLLAVNFYKEGDVFRVADTLNRVR
jgi:uncharacterized membrane protein HdeD (DUF308 family)